MNVDIKRAAKPPRKLQKLLKKLPPAPAPETVHQLRTQTRKLEAILHALSPADEGTERRLLKLLKPIRRAAGRVRDMDVLIAKTTNLSPHLQSEGLIRLVQHMAAIRNADATLLHRQVKRRQKKARFLLKSFGRDLKLPATAAPCPKAGALAPAYPGKSARLSQRREGAGLHAAACP
jgi:CHAD domain-containing protein